MPKLLEYGYLSQHATLGRGTTLTPEEERPIFTYKLPASNLDSIFMYLNMGPDDDTPFPIEVIYTSIYEDERWMVSTNDNEPVKVD